MTLALWMLLALAQDEDAVRNRVAETRTKCVTLLDGVDGVTSVNFAGSESKYRLLISVRDYIAKDAAKKKIGGDAYEGVPILWTVTRTVFTKPETQTIAMPQAPAAENPDKPVEVKPLPKTPSAASADPDIPDCDIVRAQLGLPALHRMVGGVSWKSWVPCQVWRRSVQSSGGGHTYLYTKHRPGCPFQDGLASDVYREGFLYPFEIRGSDLNWQWGVAQDLAAKFPRPMPAMTPKTGYYRRDTPTR
jgi:hypothetical protein